MNMQQYGLAFRSQLGFEIDPRECIERNELALKRNGIEGASDRIITLRGEGDVFEENNIRNTAVSKNSNRSKVSQTPSNIHSPSNGKQKKKPEWNVESGASFAGPGKRASNLFDSNLRKDSMRLSELKAKADIRSGRVKETKKNRKAWDDSFDPAMPTKGGRKTAGQFGAPPPVPRTRNQRPTARYGIPRLYPVPKRYANVKRKRPLWEPKNRPEEKPTAKEIMAVSTASIKAHTQKKSPLAISKVSSSSVVIDELSLSDPLTDNEDDMIQIYNPAAGPKNNAPNRRKEPTKQGPKQVHTKTKGYAKQSNYSVAYPQSPAIGKSRLQQAVNQAVERETQALLERIETMVVSRVGSVNDDAQARQHGSQKMRPKPSQAVKERDQANRTLKALDRLISLEERIKRKWSHLDEEEKPQSPMKAWRSENLAKQANKPLPKPHGWSTPKQTKFPQVDEQTTASILENLAEFQRHRKMVEATLQGTGMSQFQVVESAVDVLYQKYLTEVSEELVGSCDSIAEVLFQTI